MVSLTVGLELPKGVASMRKPVMVSTLERQVRVKEVSFTSEMRTRRGGLTSASRWKENRDKPEQWRWREMCPFMVQPVTFQSGRLSLQRSTGDRVLQSVHMYLVCGCHLQYTDMQLIFTHWLTMKLCKYWHKNSVYHEPWYDDTCGVWSNVHLFGGAVDVLGDNDYTVACQACIGGPPWHSEGGGTDLWDHQAGWSRDYWDSKETFRIGVWEHINQVMNVLMFSMYFYLWPGFPPTVCWVCCHGGQWL